MGHTAEWSVYFVLQWSDAGAAGGVQFADEWEACGEGQCGEHNAT